MTTTQLAVRSPRARLIAALLGALAVTGCATFSPDGGFGAVQTIAKQRLNADAQWTRSDTDTHSAQATVTRLLSEPLTADSALQIALLNNPGLQAAYAELGIAEADRVQAGRMPNPLFTYRNTRGGGEFEIERMIGFSVFDLLTMPARYRIGTRRFEAAKGKAAADTIAVALTTRQTFFEAVAARQTVRYMKEVVEAAEASRDLALRMNRVGNWSKLNLAREQLFYAEATAQLARAQQTQAATREALTRLLGLWGSGLEFQLQERLPDLPTMPRELNDAEQLAIEQRLDVQAAKLDLNALAGNLELGKATRFFNVLEAGPAQVRDSGKPNLNGYEITLDIPLFDWGGARVAKAEALYMRSAHRLRQTAVNARSQVRESYLAYRSDYDIAKHYRDEIVPLRKKISDEQLLRYNGMLIGVFELLADRRDQVASVNGYIGALRSYWIADTNLQRAMLGGGTGGMQSSSDSPAAAVPMSSGAGGH